jgi:hypothetical protein
MGKSRTLPQGRLCPEKRVSMKKLIAALAFAAFATVAFAQTPASTTTQTTTTTQKKKVVAAVPAPTEQEIADARAKGLVWVNTSTKAYHKEGKYYGKTKRGKFMTEDEAKAAGYTAAPGLAAKRAAKADAAK